MDMNDLAKSLFNSKRAEGASNVSNAKTVQGTVVEDSEDGKVMVVIDGDCVTADGTNEVEIGTVASLKEGDETIILLEGGGVMRPTALGSVGWGDKAAKTATAYITEIDDAGITVHPSGSTTDYAQINANGMDVVKGGTSVAKFGSTARVGQIDKAHVIIDDSDMQFYGDDGTSIASFGANVRIGQESGLHQTSNASAISFYDENDVVAYISTDKFFSVNSEVEDAFYIGNYSLRNASDGKFVIGLRQ